MDLFFLIGLLGIVSGFLSGLLGIGGGIIMAPLLLYVPPIFGLEPLSMQSVAGLTIVQGLLGCFAGMLMHRKFKFVSDSLTVYMGVSIFIAALIGGASSMLVSNNTLLFLFACLAIAAAVLIFISDKGEEEYPDPKLIDFSKTKAITTATGVGLLGGMVGQGGSFILIPLMTWFVKIPTRIAIGSNLGIVLLSTFAAFIGKVFTGQIEWYLVLPVAVTVIPAAFLGSLVSRNSPVQVLRRVLAVLIGFTALRIWFSILFT